MDNYTEDEFNDNGWALDSQLKGPVIAFIVLLHLLFALPANLFVVMYSLCHRQDFKKGAIILLFFLAVSNLIMALLYMPFVVVATSASEWILGNTDHTRNVLCHLHGFVYEYSITVSNHILVVISIERFFYIVKINLHSKLMSWKVISVIMAAVWTFPVLWCLFPIYGVGSYDWSFSSGGCLAFILHGQNHTITIIFIIYSLILFGIIFVTTLWTYIFTHGFLKKNLRRQQSFTFSATVQSNYNQRVRNLAGIFGFLLLINLFSWIMYAFPPVFYALIGDGVVIVPVEIDAVLFIFSFSNTVANPIIQIYFRNDMRKVIMKLFHCKSKERRAETSSSISMRNNSCKIERKEDKNHQEAKV